MPSAPLQPASRYSPRYSLVAIFLHWMIAAMIIGMIILGKIMHDADGRQVETLYQLHKSIGITILILTLSRVIWRLLHKPPPLPKTFKSWEQQLSHLIHLGFYGLMIAMPLGGWALASTAKVQVPTVLFGTVSWPHLPLLGGLAPAAKASLYPVLQTLHEGGSWLFIAMLALHVGGALKHEFSTDESVVKRMLPGNSQNAAPISNPLKSMGLAFGSALVFFLLFAIQPLLSTASDANAAPQAASAPVKEGNWRVDPAQSDLGFSGTHDGNAFSGTFKNWTAVINFDPENVPAANATILVYTDEISIAKKLYADTLKGPEWLYPASFPTATVALSDFALADADTTAYTAIATMTLKQAQIQVPLSFTLTIKNDVAQVSGKTILSRTALNIGQDSDPDAEWVSDEIIITFNLTATRI